LTEGGIIIFDDHISNTVKNFIKSKLGKNDNNEENSILKQDNGRREVISNTERYLHALKFSGQEDVENPFNVLYDHEFARKLWSHRFIDFSKEEGWTWNQFEQLLYQYNKLELIKWYLKEMDWGKLLGSIETKLRDSTLHEVIQNV